MKISIAMCTCNGAEFLEEQLSSLREQTKPPFEVVICDDGSTDATPTLVRAFAATAPFPVVFVSNPVNLGSTRNFDQAIGLCRGEAIALCDQDDLWAPIKLERLAGFLEKESRIGGVFSDAGLIDGSSAALPRSLWEQRGYIPRLQNELLRNCAAQLLEYNPATGATFVFRSSFVPQIHPIPQEWVHDAWIALLIALQCRLALLPEKLISYRIHPAQQIGVRRVRPSNELLIKKWAALEERLPRLSIDPEICRIVRSKRRFFETRQAIRSRSLFGRAWAASVALPGYFSFARGLFSYAVDVAGVKS